jgi:hypothetical protein
LAKNEGQATELAIGIRRDLPSGDCGGAAETFCWSEKGVGGAQALESAVVGNFGKGKSFGFGEGGESGGGQNGGFERGEGAGHLIVLGGFEDIGGVEGKKEADGVWAVWGDSAKKKGEVEAGPGPRFAGEVCDGNESGERGHLGGSRSGGQEKARVGHGGCGEEQTEGAGGDKRKNLRKMH